MSEICELNMSLIIAILRRNAGDASCWQDMMTQDRCAYYFFHKPQSKAQRLVTDFLPDSSKNIH
jgi:hypothetical protein